MELIRQIAVLEDDERCAISLHDFLVRAFKCRVDIFNNIADGYKAASSGDYDVIILDLIFKKEKIIAHHFIWKLRSLGVKVPIIIISALWAVESKLKSFGFGADEYITKPYIPREVVARIIAIIRRFNGFASPVCKIGPFSIHLDNREVYCKNQKTGKDTPVVLTGKEYSILEILTTKNGIVPKETLLNYLYGGLDEVPETKIIDVFVCKLRKKLIDASGGIDLIQTVWGRGYQLNRNIGDDSSDGSKDINSDIHNFIKNNTNGSMDFNSRNDMNIIGQNNQNMNYGNFINNYNNISEMDNSDFLKTFNNNSKIDDLSQNHNEIDIMQMQDQDNISDFDSNINNFFSGNNQNNITGVNQMYNHQNQMKFNEKIFDDSTQEEIQ
jgi:two-component system cell cycle response regulator CtrA